ncbi:MULTISPECIES: transcription factor FapR [Selenomonas]|uniref:Transcription factor FapR family protein n=1 Tax=Selenomonas artemidis F0399 TaxID=749551 RepID=E7N0F1_9FIRM|nr:MULTISPECIES: transcription factor FapR [Selenomonas]EFR40497.1 transcription factor FapR family protein [Selenomonas sp. oral taxon 137 str. F0430]EFW30363.1 transcription factor FapR family protein [Selenomonas artemidis F0399]EJP31828.1 putative transcription factor FapR [Selenomonas sp. FOBRC9]MBF1681904.1 transcription factor FapR [Selenomonas artemidis]
MTEKKRRRQEILVSAVHKEPFLTDEALAKKLAVSVQTVRLDRTELGIPELRARVRTLAEHAREKVRAIPHTEVVGDLLSLDLGRCGTSALKVTDDLLFADLDVARGTALFSQANSLALAIIDAPVAMTGVANVKYKVPIRKGDTVIARAEIVKVRGNKTFVWVKTYREDKEVFRAKFIVVSLEK